MCLCGTATQFVLLSLAAGSQPLWQGQICVGAKLLHNGPDQMLYTVQAFAAGQTCPPDLGMTWPAKIIFEKLTPQRSFVKAAGQLLGSCPKVRW